MPRKIGKNVAKKSRSRSRSTIRSVKVSRSSRRNSRRNSVVKKRKKKSRRKQRGRGNNNSGGYTAMSDNRPQCQNNKEVAAAAEISDQGKKPDEAQCLMTNDQCKEQGKWHLIDYVNYRRPLNAPCVGNKTCKYNEAIGYGSSSFSCR